ncbi:MAG: HD domain-containing protein [Spirochaeta sp.]|nr:HD domain-containing protein [Spirochaeta sp.]
MKYFKLYQSMIEEINGIFGDVASGVHVKHDQIDDVVQNILDKVRESKNDLVQLIQRGAGSERELAAGSVNCAVLSAVIGMSMKISGHRLIQLVTAALLHDIGMVRVAKEILSKSEKLTAEELQQVRTHPLYGYRIISKELKYPEDVAVVALQHQERWDGKGYPRCIRGEDIELPARIAAVADAYEAMINIRPYRSSLIGYSAVKGILSDNGKHFDPQVLKAFLESVGIYPVGSILQLNNSSIGRVVANQKAAPLRPEIELLVDEYGVWVTERVIIDLLEKKKLFIVKAIDPRTVNE